MIPFNRTFKSLNEVEYISKALNSGSTSGDNIFTQLSTTWLKESLGSQDILLTHSCTAALEMAAILINLGPGDEVIMPSYTFVSTANAFVLRGAKPIFVDIKPDTLNINEDLIEEAITPKTKAIVPVHYAGVACDMDKIMSIAEKYKLCVIEDAAQGIMSSYKGRPLGSIGHLGTLSFHETKNISCGEGGALSINSNSFIERAHIIREKGTNRSQFLAGKVDKYRWIDIGSSYLPSDITAAYLLAQLEEAEKITAYRLTAWNYYQKKLAPLEGLGYQLPSPPKYAEHNAHIYQILCPDDTNRDDIISSAYKSGVQLTSHYTALHSAPAGREYATSIGSMCVTNKAESRVIRLPVWPNVDYRRTADLVTKAILSLPKK